ncbi:MAG: trigger factor [Patescibacteria group bacterium]
MQYTLKEKKTLPKSEFLLALEIPAEEITRHRAHVLSHLKKDMELPGFRKGFVPERIIRERMGELAIWEEAATDALGEALAEIFRAEKLDVIGRPRVEPQKLAPENPAEFKVTLSLYPDLTLPEYKEIAAERNKKEAEPVSVEEKEIDAVISEIKKQHGAVRLPPESGQATGAKDFAVTDETVKEFGAFSTVADFRAKVKEGLLSHKETRNKEKRRAELLDVLAGKAKGDIPEVMILGELARMESELRSEIERMGGSFDAYLKEIKKDADALKKEWREDAERRARLQLMLFQIARAEKLTAPEKEIEEEVKHLLEHYKDASPENAWSYAETLLTNRNVIQFLEKQR